jgi:mRNA interferase RelE/StbE
LNWKIKIHPGVVKKIKFWRGAYIHRFERLIDEIGTYGPMTRTLDVKQMSGKENIYRVRIGKNRIVFKADKALKVVYIIEAGSRGGIYK